MPSLGTLEYEIGANTRKFLGEMQKVDGRLKQTAVAMRKGINTAGKYSGAFAAAGLAIGATLVKAQLSAIDSTAKFADTVGLTTEQLIGLRHAAAITGVSAAELDTGIRRMEKNVSDASNGLSTAVRVFDDLGISIDEIRKLSPDEQIKTIADAFGGVPNQADKARIAQDLFGRSGIKLIKTMEEGSAGIAELQAEAVKLGIAYSRVDAAQVEAANDAITRAQASFSSVAQKVTVELAPSIKAVADELTDVMLNAEGVGDSIMGAFEGALNVVGVFADGIHGVKIIFKGVQLAAQTFGAAVINVFTGVQEATARILKAIMSGVITVAEQSNALGFSDFDTSGMKAMRDGLDRGAEHLRGFRETVNANLAETKAELDSVMMEPLPSQVLDKFVADVKVRSAEAREAMQKELDQKVDAPKIAPVTVPVKTVAVDTAPLNDALSVLQNLQSTRATRIRFNVDADALDDARMLLDSISQSEVSIPGLDMEQLTQAGSMLETLREKSAMGVDLSPRGVAEAQAAIEQMAAALQNAQVPESMGKDAERQKARDAEAEAQQEEMQARLDRIAEEFATEKQLEMIHHADRLKFLESAKQSEFDLTGKFDKLIENEKERHAKKLAGIGGGWQSMMLSDQLSFYNQMEAATKQTGMAQVSTMAGAFEQISAAGSRENKKLFQVNKIAGIANATISTFTGAAKALELGPIAGPIAAAAIIANGLAKVQAIKSQSFSSGGSAGGGGNTAPSIAASAPAQPVSNVGGGGSRQAISIRFSGGNENQRSAIRDFAEQLNDFIDDGGEVGRFAFE